MSKKNSVYDAYLEHKNKEETDGMVIKLINVDWCFDDEEVAEKVYIEELKHAMDCKRGFYRYVLRLRANYDEFEKFKRKHLIFTDKIDLHMLFENTYEWNDGKHPVLDLLFSRKPDAAQRAFEIIVKNVDPKNNILYCDNNQNNNDFAALVYSYNMYADTSEPNEDFLNFRFQDNSVFGTTPSLRDKKVKKSKSKTKKKQVLKLRKTKGTYCIKYVPPRADSFNILYPELNTYEKFGFEYKLSRNHLMNIIDYHYKVKFKIDIADEKREYINKNNFDKEIVKMYYKSRRCIKEDYLYNESLGLLISLVLSTIKSNEESYSNNDVNFKKFKVVKYKERSGKQNNIKFQIMKEHKASLNIDEIQEILKCRIKEDDEYIMLFMRLKDDYISKVCDIIYNNVELESIKRFTNKEMRDKCLERDRYDDDSIKEMLSCISMSDFETFFKVFDENSEKYLELNLDALEYTENNEFAAVKKVSRQLEFSIKSNGITNMPIIIGEKFEQYQMRLCLLLSTALTKADGKNFYIKKESISKELYDNIIDEFVKYKKLNAEFKNKK